MVTFANTLPGEDNKSWDLFLTYSKISELYPLILMSPKKDLFVLLVLGFTQLGDKINEQKKLMELENQYK